LELSATAQQVATAVQELYRPGCTDHAGVNQQLTAFQGTNEAWPVAVELLRHPEMVVRYYGATTLGVKVKQDWGSLDEVRPMRAGSVLISSRSYCIMHTHARLSSLAPCARVCCCEGVLGLGFFFFFFFFFFFLVILSAYDGYGGRSTVVFLCVLRRVLSFFLSFFLDYSLVVVILGIYG
jgi:hypothetical protein